MKQHRKIDIYTVSGKYLCSTTWSKTLKEAKEKYAEKENLTSTSYLKASFSK